jgi:hypothetical protein
MLDTMVAAGHVSDEDVAAMQAKLAQGSSPMGVSMAGMTIPPEVVMGGLTDLSASAPFSNSLQPSFRQKSLSPDAILPFRRDARDYGVSMAVLSPGPHELPDLPDLPDLPTIE